MPDPEEEPERHLSLDFESREVVLIVTIILALLIIFII